MVRFELMDPETAPDMYDDYAAYAAEIQERFVNKETADALVRDLLARGYETISKNEDPLSPEGGFRFVTKDGKEHTIRISRKELAGDISDLKNMLFSKEEDLLIEALKSGAKTLQDISKDMLTEHICLAAVDADPGAIRYVPEDMRTADMWLDSVAGDGMLLQFAADKTEQLIFAALIENPEAIRFVKPEEISEPFAERLVLQNPNLLPHMPNQTYEICRTAVTQDTRLLDQVRDASIKERLIDTLKIGQVTEGLGRIQKALASRGIEAYVICPDEEIDRHYLKAKDGITISVGSQGYIIAESQSYKTYTRFMENSQLEKQFLRWLDVGAIRRTIAERGLEPSGFLADLVKGLEETGFSWRIQTFPKSNPGDSNFRITTTLFLEGTGGKTAGPCFDGEVTDGVMKLTDGVMRLTVRDRENGRIALSDTNKCDAYYEPYQEDWPFASARLDSLLDECKHIAKRVKEELVLSATKAAEHPSTAQLAESRTFGAGSVPGTNKIAIPSRQRGTASGKTEPEAVRTPNGTR